ncbi:MAG: VCBS repeat-containing protein [Verrucomicrobiota bacterium]
MKFWLLLAGCVLMAGTVFAESFSFEREEIDGGVEIGYGLAVGDVDGDGKDDVILADKVDLVWYRNPDWERYVIAKGLSLRDNVCVAAADLDGDGKVEIAAGANWNPAETSDEKASGSVHVFTGPDDVTRRWPHFELPHEPTVHRMHWVEWREEPEGEARWSLVVLPLHGRGNVKGEGENGVRVFAYDVPVKAGDWGNGAAWERRLLSETMHVTHNFDVLGHGEVAVGGLEGIERIDVSGAHGAAFFETEEYADGARGLGEIRRGPALVGDEAKTERYVSVEPLHGNRLVVRDVGTGEMEVLEAGLKHGHALACGDLDGDGNEEIVVGWRQPDAEERVGIKIYSRGEDGWEMALLDDNGMACEDLKVVDLDGDGRLDVVGSGRATGNVVIYWNRGE